MATRKVAKKAVARRRAAKKAGKRTAGKSAARKATKKTTKKAAKRPVARKAAAKKSSARKATKKTVAKKAAAKKPVARKATKVSAAKKVAGKSAARKATAGQSAARKTADTAMGRAASATAMKSPRKAVRPATPKGPAPQRAARGAAKRAGGITPEQALANTRALLEAKQAHDREPPPWQTFNEGGGSVPQPGFQSDEARVKADELHEGEMRLQANQGSVSSTGRRNQGRRDSREGT